MPASQDKITIEISSLTMIKVLIIILLVFFLFFIRQIILLVFVSLILASAFDPWVDYMQKHKMPRVVGVLIIYAIVFLVLGFATYSIIPPIAIEVSQLANDFPVYWENINSSLQNFRAFSTDHGLNDNISGSLKAVQDALSGGVFSTIWSFFGGVVSFFIIMMITFYMTVDEQALKRMLRSTIPVKYQPYFTYIVNRMQEKIGLWLRGQLLLSFIIFILTLIVLTIAGVKYALVLALFAGITEIIPYIGPFIGLVPAVFIAFTQSPMLALIILIAYLIIQQLENNFIVPQVMKKAVGLNPIVTIVVMLVGFQIAGVLGVLLAIPVTTAAGVLFEDIFFSKDKEIKKTT